MSLPGRVAIVHYWLVGMRGGERVLERLLHLFPQAVIFTHVYDPAAVSYVIRARKVKTSFIQKLPFARRNYQRYLPFMPLALEELDLRGYDLVISSESGPAKGVITSPNTLHVCYCHSPMRYIWDHYQDYKESSGRLTRLAMPLVFHYLRNWDVVSAARVDRIMANSTFVQQRINRAWRRESTVVHPPVDVDMFQPSTDIAPYYLWVGQMTAYKRADLAVDAFNQLGYPLVMVGDGEMAASLRARAKPNIQFVQRMEFAELRKTYARCRALVFTAEEDFGLVPVEAMAAGRPVLAFGSGGALDSVVPQETGLFFKRQDLASVVEGVERMERWLPSFDPSSSVARARLFSPDRFDQEVLAVIGLEDTRVTAFRRAVQ